MNRVYDVLANLVCPGWPEAAKPPRVVRWSAGILDPVSEVRMALFGNRRPASRELELVLAGGGAAAGTAVFGEVATACAVTVALLRLERSPAGLFSFAVASARAEPQEQRAPFELAAPPHLPPPATGRRCELDYAVRAVTDAPRRRRRHAAVPVEMAGGEARIHEQSGRFDRVIPGHAGRHFHLELAEAVLEGGGRIAGRIHVDADGGSVPFTLTGRCEESWCTNFRFRPRRSPPLWQTQPLWEETISVPCDPDRHWLPFRFELPSQLPPGVEGRAIAWRYSVEARRSRRGFSDSAIVTPLRFEI
jgi:hypothetical protein